MRILTRPESTPQVLQIPEKIQTDIEEKWFHLYKWISPDEVKLSIERDFLKTLKYIGAPLGIIAIIAGLLTVFGFFIVLFLGIFLMFLYLLILSLRRSSLLAKGAFVVVTDSSISLWGKIVKLSELQDIGNEMNHIENQFEEKLFGDSELEKSKSSLTRSVMEQLFGGYKFIFNNSDIARGRDSEKFLLAVIALYTLYAIMMAGVYFVWVLFLWVFGALMTKINTWYLLSKWHSVLKINELFWNIDRTSQDIQSEKIELQGFLKEAYDNNWQDGLLTKINHGILSVQQSAEAAVDDVISLRNTIEHSQYKDMFSFNIYNGWIKKQIRDPLAQILSLLQKHQGILEDTISEIKKQKDASSTQEHISALALQIKRLEIQLWDIERFIPTLEKSIEKLHS